MHEMGVSCKQRKEKEMLGGRDKDPSIYWRVRSWKLKFPVPCLVFDILVSHQSTARKKGGGLVMFSANIQLKSYTS